MPRKDAPKRKDPKYKTEKKKTLEDGLGNKPYKCSCCGKGYKNQKGNFSMSPSPYYDGNGGYLTICRNCIEKTFQHYKDDVFDGDEDKAMELVCAGINTVFDLEAWKFSKMNRRPQKTRITVYFSKLNLHQTLGTSYADTVMWRLQNQKSQDDEYLEATRADFETSQDSETPKIEIPPETLRRFGPGFSNAEYALLSDEYDDWVRQYGEPENKRQDELFKTACLLKLRFQRAVRTNDKDVSNISRVYKDYVDAATVELEEDKRKQEDSVKQDPLGVWIADIEKYAPAELFQEKSLFHDFDQLGAYATRFIFRPLKNLLTGSKELDPEYAITDGGNDDNK